jgi:hypothetical protein
MNGNEQTRMIAAWLASVGADDVHIEQDSGHPKLFYVWRGRRRFYVVPASPGNAWVGGRNAISNLRHELGLIKTEKTVGARRERRLRRSAPAVAPPALTALSDWRDKLAAWGR